MDPLIIASLIEAGTSVIKGIAGGKAKKQEFKRWQESLKEREKMLSKIKPTTPYYGIEQGLPTLDPVVQKAVMGIMSQRFGGSLPIDFSQLFSQMGQQGQRPQSLLSAMGGKMGRGQRESRWAAARSGGGTSGAGRYIADKRGLEI